MAGSSMDGLDLTYVSFTNTDDKWKYQLEKCEVVPYPASLYDRLKNALHHSIEDQEKLDLDFGHWIASSINQFKIGLDQHDLLSVHGHTVIHKPADNISWQLGDGATIARETGIATITEFRTLDVQNGGQGAPLVPYGDFKLFGEFDACLNLGGIANISVKENKTAWDICPCNQVLNFFSEKLGTSYDENGDFAKSGTLDEAFYTQISKLDFFDLPPPKSLPNNFIDSSLLGEVNPIDGLHTYCRIISEQIKRSLEGVKESNLLITGGGAFNGYLVKQIRSKLEGWKVHVPDAKIIAFKESLIFAFLGLKRLRNEINTLSSVTGARKDTSSGVIHLP